MKKRFVTVYGNLPFETAEKLDKLVEQSRRSRSSIIRILIENAELADLVPFEAKQETKELT